MFCAVLSYALTIWLLFEKEVRSHVLHIPLYPLMPTCADPQQDVEEEGDMSLKAIYLKMWEVMKLRRVSPPSPLPASAHPTP